VVYYTKRQNRTASAHIVGGGGLALLTSGFSSRSPRKLFEMGQE